MPRAGKAGARTASVSVRPAGPADATTLVALIRAAFAEYQGRLDPPSSAEWKSEAVLREELADAAAFLAERDGQAVGCVIAHRDGLALEWGRLAVAQAARGHGVASALMDAVETHARHLALPIARLSVRIPLVDKHAIYAARGYRVVRLERHAGYAEPTYQVMEKQLADLPCRPACGEGPDNERGTARHDPSGP